MPAKPWTDDDSARLLELHAAGKSLHAIAREMGRSKQTISKYAATAGLVWDRTRTAAAARAVTIDNKARRAALESKLLAKADDLINAIDSPFLAFSFGGKDNTYNEHQLERPPTGDIRNLMQSAGIAIDRSLKLAQHDSDARDLPAVDQWIAFMTGKMVDASGPPNGATSEGPSDSPS